MGHELQIILLRSIEYNFRKKSELFILIIKTPAIKNLSEPCSEFPSQVPHFPVYYYFTWPNYCLSCSWNSGILMLINGSIVDITVKLVVYDWQWCRRLADSNELGAYLLHLARIAHLRHPSYSGQLEVQVDLANVGDNGKSSSDARRRRWHIAVDSNVSATVSDRACHAPPLATLYRRLIQKYRCFKQD